MVIADLDLNFTFYYYFLFLLSFYTSPCLQSFPIILHIVVSAQCFFSGIEYQLFPLRPLTDGDFMSDKEYVVLHKSKTLKQKLLHVTEICLLI